MGLIRAKYKGHCGGCGASIYVGENCYYDVDSKTVMCVKCGDMGKAATAGPPVAAAMFAHGTTKETLHQLRSMAEAHLAALRTETAKAEAILLALKQIVDQQTGG